MNDKQISTLLKRHFDLTGTITALAGYDDLNFKIESPSGEKYVFKLCSNLDNLELLQVEEYVISLLRKNMPSRNFSKTFPDKSGQTVFEVVYKDKKYLARLLEFVEGICMGDVIPDDEMLSDLGSFMAAMHLQLQGENIPFLKTRNYDWDSKNVLQQAKKMQYISDPMQRSKVHYFLLQYKEQVWPLHHELRQSIIHGDANEWNILVEGGRIKGIIDFGDMVHSFTINDLAICVCYVMMMRTEAPWEAACKVVASYHKVFPLEKKELEILYYLIAARLCISLCSSSYHGHLNPENTYITINQKGGWQLIETLLRTNPKKAANTFLQACGFPVKFPKDHSVVLEKRHLHISKAMSINYKKPLLMERAAFQYMYDDKGETYLDCVNNICHVGHCHPKVVEAAQKQMARLNTNTRYLYESLADYAAMICETMPGKLRKVFFVNSGSAASDLAVRLSYAHSRRRNLIVMEHGYHGNTQLGIDISPYKFCGKGGEGARQNIHPMPLPDGFRGRWKYDDPKAGEQYADEVKKAIDALVAQGKPPAAFIAESIIGCGGQVVLPAGYLEQVYAHVRAAGGLCVADEVQVGFGRVGEKFWGFQLHGVSPDIVIIGKPIGNGHPLAAVVTTDEVARSFENGMEFFSSFGGNPVSCAIGISVLEVIKEEGLQAHAREVGEYLKKRLQQLQEKHACIGDVRGNGLFLGIEFVQDRSTLEPDEATCNYVVEKMRLQHKIMLSTDGPFHNVIKIKPPLYFNKANADAVVDGIAGLLAEQKIS